MLIILIILIAIVRSVTALNCTSNSVCGDQLVCINGTCSNCLINADCGSVNNVCLNGKCQHKSLTDGVNYFDIICVLVVFAFSVLVSPVGIGGGAVNVLFIHLIMEFPMQMSARLSLANIFGLAVVNMIYYMPLRHPRKDKPMIDYKIVISTDTFLLSGTIFGVILNIIFPEWFISLILLAILVYAGIKTVQRFVALKKQNDDEPEIEVLDANYGNYTSVFPHNCIMILSWSIIIMFSIFRGYGSTASIIGVQKCSALYWGLTVLEACLVIAIGIFVVIYLHRKFKSGVRHEIPWDIKNALILPPILFIGGIIGNASGIGIGIFKTPIMTHFKIDPDVIVATTSFGLIIVSSNTLLQYLIFGIIPIDYMILFIATGFIASTLSHLIISPMLHKKERTKYMLLFIAILIFIFALVTLGYGLYRLITNLQNGVYMGFNSFC